MTNQQNEFSWKEPKLELLDDEETAHGYAKFTLHSPQSSSLFDGNVSKNEPDESKPVELFEMSSTAVKEPKIEIDSSAPKKVSLWRPSARSIPDFLDDESDDLRCDMTLETSILFNQSPSTNSSRDESRNSFQITNIETSKNTFSDEKEEVSEQTKRKKPSPSIIKNTLDQLFEEDRHPTAEKMQKIAEMLLIRYQTVFNQFESRRKIGNIACEKDDPCERIKMFISESNEKVLRLTISFENKRFLRNYVKNHIQSGKPFSMGYIHIILEKTNLPKGYVHSFYEYWKNMSLNITPEDFHKRIQEENELLPIGTLRQLESAYLHKKYQSGEKEWGVNDIKSLAEQVGLNKEIVENWIEQRKNAVYCLPNIETLRKKNVVKRMSISEPWTEGEQTSFIRFLAEKSKNAKSPLIINQLCRDYRDKSGSSRTLQSFKRRVDIIRLEIHKLSDFDKATKVKIAFAVGAPIGKVFLEELQREAYVELDDRNRIIAYKKKGKPDENSFCFENENITINGTRSIPGNNLTKRENEKLINFIAERVTQTKSLFSIPQLGKEFIEKTGSTRKLCSLIKYINYLRPIIPKLDNFDTETKVRMLFSLSAPIDQDYLNELRNIAVVEVDEKQRISKFIANDGSLKLYKNRTAKITTRLQKNASVEFDENQRITKYEAKNKSLKSEGVHKPVQNQEKSMITGIHTNKRKLECEMESTTQKPSSSKWYKIIESKDVIYDGPGEPIPAELPVKKEQNFYDELFWQQKEYKSDLMDLLKSPVPDQTEVELEYQEQITNWQEEEEYKPDSLQLMNMEQNTIQNSIDRSEFQDFPFLDDDLLERSVKREEPEIG